MTSDEFNSIDQAVFGYSNGHRLLVSSFNLSAVDVYELAAASDLAPGAQISGSESYFTGLTLPDSKRYAIICTWLAPEMPRPGCVWSHVLLLNKTFLSTHVDLTALKDVFRRPDQYQTDESFSVPIAINRRSRGKGADPEAVEPLLWACYGNDNLKDDVAIRPATERAILAVWSQQWPRLRARFTFRSIPASSSLKGQSFEFRRGVSLKKHHPSPEWLQAALEDATSSTITPLRRFLWRYGKDINSDKQALPNLVAAYISTRSKKLRFEVADNVLELFGNGQAITLKRDMLGLSPSKLSLVPSLSSVDLMQLLAKHKGKALDYQQSEISSLFSQIEAAHVPEVAEVLVSNREELGELFSSIMGAILPLVTEDALAHGRFDERFALAAIHANPALLSERLMRLFPTEALIGFWSTEIDGVQRREILRTLLSREFVEEGAVLFYSRTSEMFEIAIDLVRQSELHESWLNLFRANGDQFPDSVTVLSNGEELMAAVRLLGFPVDPPELLPAWHAAFERTQSLLNYDDETRFAVYLLALCVRHGIENYRGPLVSILPALRQKVLHDELPVDAREMISRWLPSDDARWDLNKRLLKLFRKAYKRGVNMDDVVASLHLSNAEYAYATDQDPETAVRRLFKAFSPWNYWD
ncbi:hypothetical protein [Rhizobium leguminosarum]|uniref:GAP1-N1 domain-containing protein n=1 Tax=Rhizobium leguminosarum TaxID=384 RepID=UPI001F42672E|nr:hypothetical protein [Rhizobium leguminosarum]UIJ82422.1 hypothetical protein LZK78_24805 [Rhizobium leguminosarum]